MTRKIRANSSAVKQVVKYKESVESQTTTSATSTLAQVGSTIKIFCLTKHPVVQRPQSNVAAPAENKFVEIDLNADQKPKEVTPAVSRETRTKQAIKNAGMQLKRTIGKIGSFITTAASTIVDTLLQALNFCVKIPLLPLYLFNKVYAVAFKVDKIELPKTDKLQLHRVDTGRLAVFGGTRQSAQPTPRAVNESLQQPAIPEISEDDLEEQQQHLDQGQLSSPTPG